MTRYELEKNATLFFCLPSFCSWMLELCMPSKITGFVAAGQCWLTLTRRWVRQELVSRYISYMAQYEYFWNHTNIAPYDQHWANRSFSWISLLHVSIYIRIRVLVRAGAREGLGLTNSKNLLMPGLVHLTVHRWGGGGGGDGSGKPAM